MITLYKKTDDALLYWETWWNPDEKTAIVHWGAAGTRGERENVAFKNEKAFEAEMRERIAERSAEGFRKIEIDDFDTLMIVYKIDGFGTEANLDKRHRLEERMNETLGWTGLGLCDGGSIGSGTMEVFCFVIDYAVAEKIVREDLSGTEFADYAMIRMGHDESF